MKRPLFALALLGALLSPSFSRGENQESGTMPKVGDLAPDFTMNYFDGHGLKPVTLSDYRGKQQVVLAFYVFAFTGG
jgi:hypothetical protein